MMDIQSACNQMEQLTIVIFQDNEISKLGFMEEKQCDAVIERLQSSQT